jgi:CRP-like cAMP-binding protein
VYRIIILIPAYLLGSEYGYIRLITLVEYNDMELVIRGLSKFLTFWIKNGLLRYTLNKVFWLLFIITAYLILFSHISACVFLILENIAMGNASAYNAMDPPSRYITVLYFLITSQTSVGYGDVTVNHQSDKLVAVRYLYQLFLMLVSILINGVYYTILLVTIKEATEVFYQSKNEIEKFEDWLTAIYRRMLPSPAQNPYYLVTMLYYKLGYILNVGQVLNYGNYLSNLWPQAASQVQESMSSALFTKFEHYFSLLSPELVPLLTSKMQPAIFLKGDVVLRRRDRHEGIWFILDGYIQVTYRETESPLQHLQIGDEFGDGCLMESKSHFNYVCKTNCLCLFVPKDKLLQALNLSPKDNIFLKQRARLRLRKLVNIREKIVETRRVLGSMKSDPRLSMELQSPAVTSPLRSALSIEQPDYSRITHMLQHVNKDLFRLGMSLIDVEQTHPIFQLWPNGSDLDGSLSDLPNHSILSPLNSRTRQKIASSAESDPFLLQYDEIRQVGGFNNQDMKQETVRLSKHSSPEEGKNINMKFSNIYMQDRLNKNSVLPLPRLSASNIRYSELTISQPRNKFVEIQTFTNKRGLVRQASQKIEEGKVIPRIELLSSKLYSTTGRYPERKLLKPGQFISKRLEAQQAAILPSLADELAAECRHRAQTSVEQVLCLGSALHPSFEQDLKPKPALLTIERIKNYVFSHESRLKMLSESVGSPLVVNINCTRQFYKSDSVMNQLLDNVRRKRRSKTHYFTRALSKINTDPYHASEIVELPSSDVTQDSDEGETDKVLSPSKLTSKTYLNLNNSWMKKSPHRKSSVGSQYQFNQPRESVHSWHKLVSNLPNMIPQDVHRTFQDEASDFDGLEELFGCLSFRDLDTQKELLSVCQVAIV